MKHTYLVEHKDGTEPMIKADTEILGGKVIAVAFGDEFARIEKLEQQLAEAKRQAKH